MQLDRFRRLLDLHGADLERWPVDERAAAETLLADSGEATAARRDAARLDALLCDLGEPIPAGSIERVLDRVGTPSAAPPPARARAAPARLAVPLASTALLGLTAIAGFLAGALVTEAGGTRPVDLVALATSDFVSGLGL